MADQTYEQGLVDGKLLAVEAILADHKIRIDGHSGRLRLLERALWIMLGVVAVVQFVPFFYRFINGVG